MSLFKQFKTNSDLETEGVKIEFPEAINEDGTIPAFIVCRMGRSNRVYAKALEAETRNYRRQIELGTLKDEVAEHIQLNVFVKTILKGWENVKDENDQTLPFTRENASKLMIALPDVYDRLMEEAKIASNFRDQALEAESKN